MGSFSELVMSFPLRPDVGDDVLAAFASIAIPTADSPALPPPVVDNDEDWALDFEEMCDMTHPWSHDWGAWLNASYTTAYIGSDQRASMIWRDRRWVVTARATWKSAPEAFVGNLAVLGTIIDAEGAPHYPDWLHADQLVTGFHVGYTKHEAEPRPWLLWADGSTLRAENLNPPDFVL
jgi:hypothetical protein